MNPVKAILFLYIIQVTLSGCHPLPASSLSDFVRIQVGYGPEDMVIDSLNGDPRILLSCASRREVYPPFGEILCLDPDTREVKVLIRSGEPDSLSFRPHGIYLDGNRLYVINHEQEPDKHPVMIYRVGKDSLVLEDIIRSPLLNSPNALVTGEDGSVYCVNDSGKRGSLAEKIFRLRRAGAVRFRKTEGGTWIGEPVVQGLGYPAGINRIGNQLFIGDATRNRIHTFRIDENTLVHTGDIKGIKGCDNLRIYRNRLLVPGHIKPFRFIRHIHDPGNLSPVEIFMVNPFSGQLHSLYCTDGSAISAGSTALILDHSLYISQIFDPYLLVVNLEPEYKKDYRRFRSGSSQDPQYSCYSLPRIPSAVP